MTDMKLVLSTGQEFEGLGTGVSRIAIGEVIFNTSMVGYQEIVSDPSYAGQIVVMTYPLIGQYGIADEDGQSRIMGPEGIVIREMCDTPSNFRATKTFSEYLTENSVPCLSGVDTRMITGILRDNAPVMGAIVPSNMPRETALDYIKARCLKDSHDITETVSCTKRWFSRTPQHRFDIVVIDCGLKRRVLAELNHRGCNVTVVPFNATAAEVMSFRPDGVLVSSGPGNPNDLGMVVNTIRELRGNIPLCGMGLGHQLIAISYGAKVERQGCGHHGGHPVRDVATGRIFTAELNYCFAVDSGSVKGSGLEIAYVDAVDGTVEGLASAKDRVLTCEFSPEGFPGPQESDIFDKFVGMMEK